MKMNKCLFLLPALVLLLTACGGNGNTAPFIGKVTLDGYEGRHVYLEMTDDAQTVVDSALVKDGRFSFNLNDSTPQVYQLVLKETDDDIFPILLPIVSEKGNLYVSMGELVYTSGTPLNDKLQDFLLAVSNLGDRKLENEADLEKYKADYAALLQGFILQNAGNVVGEYIFHTYHSKLSEQQKSVIKEKTNGRFE